MDPKGVRDPKLWAALLLATVVYFLWIAVARAHTLSVEQPLLEPVASEVARQPIEVRCWTNDGTDPDANPDAWGYVWLAFPVVYLDPIPCAGALAIARHELLPLWQQALGALVLTHEAYHLNVFLPEWRRGDEAQTECRAIKRIPETFRDLGASRTLADLLLPWALTAHYKLTGMFAPGNEPAYAYPSCKVPGMNWWP